MCNQSIYNLMNQILISKKKRIDNKYFFMCFNIIKHQRNANQSYIESPSLISQYGYYWKSKIYQIWSRVWENNLNSLLVQGTLTQILWKLVLNFLKKKNLKLPWVFHMSYSTIQHTPKERTLYTTSVRHAHQDHELPLDNGNQIWFYGEAANALNC